MIGIIIGILLLLAGIISLSIYCETEKNKMAVLSFICFMLAIIAPWIGYSNNYYNHKVTVIAQNGQEYIYEECHAETFRDRVVIEFEDEPSITFYSPIKVEESEDNEH